MRDSFYLVWSFPVFFRGEDAIQLFSVLTQGLISGFQRSPAGLIVYATLGIASAIFLEAGFSSFLGNGVQPATASWGNIINVAATVSASRVPLGMDARRGGSSADRVGN